jgi:hypothetical protein
LVQGPSGLIALIGHGRKGSEFVDQRPFTMLRDAGFAPSPVQVWAAYNDAFLAAVGLAIAIVMAILLAGQTKASDQPVQIVAMPKE